MLFMQYLPTSEQKHQVQMLLSVFATAEPVDFQDLMPAPKNVSQEQPL